MKILIGSVISRHPYIPGSVWNRMHFALGLQRLGHDVLFVEEVDPERCVDFRGCRTDYLSSSNRTHFLATMKRFDLSERSCQMLSDGREGAGMTMAQLRSWLRGCDLLLNFSGHLRLDFLLTAPRRRAYLDQDPVYTQLWNVEYGAELGLKRHDVLFTCGLNVGRSAEFPSGEHKWHAHLPPVVLGEWRSMGAADSGAITTIASIGRYKDLSRGGRCFGSKRSELYRFAEVPRRTRHTFKIALLTEGAHDLATAMAAGGWLVERAEDLGDVDKYRRYILASAAEFSIAKSAYVTGRSGWFSERSAQYLAAGKPVIAQSTGLEGAFPVGTGLLTFSDPDEAVAAVESVKGSYLRHAQAALDIAHEYLDSNRVLPRMLEVAMSSSEVTASE